MTTADPSHTLTVDGDGVSADSTDIDVSTGDADSVEVEVQPEDTTAGEAIGGPPMANVTDQFGNPVEGETVEVASNGTLSGISDGDINSTNSDGVTTFSFQESAESTYVVGFELVSDTSVNDTATVTVEEDTPTPSPPSPTPTAEFTISIDDVPSSVTAGQTLTATVTITNDGNADGTQIVTLRNAAGDTIDEIEVSLDAGANQTVELTWETTPDNIVEETLTIAIEDDGTTIDITVEPQPVFFDVTDTESPSGLVVEETFSATVLVENSGDTEATQTIILRHPDGTILAQQDVTVAGQGSETVTLNWEPSQADIGSMELTVESDDAVEQVDVTVEPDAPFFDVAIDTVTSPVTAGEDVAVTATITNTGEEAGIQNIVLRDDTGIVQDETEIELAPGDSTTITLMWTTTDDDSGHHSITVASEDEEATGEVTVDPTDHRYGAFIVAWFWWLLLAGLLVAVSNDLIQTRGRGILPFLDTPEEHRDERFRAIVIRLGGLSVGSLVAGLVVLELLWQLGIRAPTLLLILIALSIIVGTSLAGAIPDIDRINEQPADDHDPSLTSEDD